MRKALTWIGLLVTSFVSFPVPTPLEAQCYRCEARLVAGGQQHEITIDATIVLGNLSPSGVHEWIPGYCNATYGHGQCIGGFALAEQEMDLLRSGGERAPLGLVDLILRKREVVTMAKPGLVEVRSCDGSETLSFEISDRVSSLVETALSY